RSGTALFAKLTKRVGLARSIQLAMRVRETVMTSYITLPCAAGNCDAKAGASSGSSVLVHRRDPRQTTHFLVIEQSAGPQQRSDAAIAQGQFRKAAHLDDPALVHEHHKIGIPDGGQAVGDDEGGAVTAQLVDRLLHTLFRFHVKRAGGFVQNEDR